MSSKRPDRPCPGGHRQHSRSAGNPSRTRESCGRGAKARRAPRRRVPASARADRGPRLFQARPRPDGRDPLQMDGPPREMANIMSTRPSARIPRPIVNGPLSREAAIQMVDDRESDARRRFEQLKSEMTGRAPRRIWCSEDGGEM